MRWIQSAQSNPAFFDVEPLPNVMQVALNTKHPVHSHLYDIMHPDVEDMAEDEVRERAATLRRRGPENAAGRRTATAAWSGSRRHEGWRRYSRHRAISPSIASRNNESWDSPTWRLFHSPDARTMSRSLKAPSQSPDGGSGAGSTA